MVSVVEGTNRHQDHAQVLNANLALTMSIVGATMLIAAAVHIGLWRSVCRRPPVR
jgi:hypothetical protein